MVLLTIVLFAALAFAQDSLPTAQLNTGGGNTQGQGPTILNGGIAESFTNVPGAIGASGPGLGRHDILESNTQQPLGCETCHLPHTAPVYGASFLWAWSQIPTTVSTYVTETNVAVTLTSAALSTNPRNGNARSILCLTCHDATSASANGISGAFGLLATTGTYTGSLGSEHPVEASVPLNGDYNQPVAVTGSLANSGDAVVATIGADSLPLWTGQGQNDVECSSCHDQHADWQYNNGASGGYPFLRVANTGGTYLCRECHKK
jgi:hypothetical protein